MGTVDQKYTVTAQDSNKVFTVTIDATSGNFKLTFNGQQTADIASEATANTVLLALEALATPVPGDFTVTGSAGGPYTVEAKGQYAGLSSPTLTAQNIDLAGGGTTAVATVAQPGAVTWQVTFTPPLDGGSLTVRSADEAPMDVALNFVYEHITSGTNEAIAPMDAIKRRNGAADWINAADDVCEPYAIDLLVVHTPPCGTAEKEFTLFPDFRSEQRDVSFKDSNIKVTGKCNIIDPITWRGDVLDEPA